MNGGGHQTEHQTDGRMEASGWIASVRIAGDDAAVQALRLVLEDAALVLHVLQGALADHESISAISDAGNFDAEIARKFPDVTFLGHLAGRLVRDHGWIKGILAVDIAGVVRRALVTTDGTISCLQREEQDEAAAEAEQSTAHRTAIHGDRRRPPKDGDDQLRLPGPDQSNRRCEAPRRLHLGVTASVAPTSLQAERNGIVDVVVVVVVDDDDATR